MEERKDSATVLDWLQRSGVQDSFDTSGLEFSVRIYGKGEIITSPDKPADNLMFIAEGSGEIYGIRQDGSLNPVALVSAPGIIGDFEFIGTGGTPFYVEARTAMTCIVLHSGQSRSRLMADPRFLYMLLMSIADKFSMFVSIEGVEGTVEDRLLRYLSDFCPEGVLDGVGKAMYMLRCSRRQLQRSLSALCEKGLIMRIGKGRCRLL